ncbi:MAG: Rab family GTPase [Promethearchaeota archaeon]
MSGYDASYKVIVLGDAGVGKTTFIEKCAKPIFDSDNKMTIGVDFDVKSMDVDGRKIKLGVWDFGYEERFRFLVPTYVRGANGVIIMYDVTRYTSLAHIDDWLLFIRREIKTEQDAFPIILVGNKADLQNDREVSGEDGINFAKSRGLQGFIECSAKTGENAEEIFDALTRLMMERSRLL